MTRRRLAQMAVALGLLALAAMAWFGREGGDERTIRKRLEALRDEVNTGTGDGLATVTRAAQIARYFTDDVVVELGGGAPPIRGRDTLIGMVVRLQPRTAAFRLDLDDISVEMQPDRQTADVVLTASFIGRTRPGDDESLDAREFALVMTRGEGAWRIASITAIDTLKH